MVFLLHYSYTLHDSQEGAHTFTASVEEALRKEERLLENAEMSLSSPIKVQRYVQEKGTVSASLKTKLHRSKPNAQCTEKMTVPKYLKSLSKAVA